MPPGDLTAAFFRTVRSQTDAKQVALTITRKISPFTLIYKLLREMELVSARCKLDRAQGVEDTNWN